MFHSYYRFNISRLEKTLLDTVMLSSKFVRTFVYIDNQAKIFVTVIAMIFILVGCTGYAPQMPPPSTLQNKIITDTGRQKKNNQDNNKSDRKLRLIRGYISQEPLLKDRTDHQDNIDSTWLALTKFTPQSLNDLIINPDEVVLQGWLDLTRLYHDRQQYENRLKIEIENWQTLYPHHPAAKELPTPLKRKVAFVQASITKIALLLPLSGSTKIFGEAIKQGFFAAQSESLSIPIPDSDQANLDNLNTEEKPIIASELSVTQPLSSLIKVYDTKKQSISSLLIQAQQDGATLVIGPLLKPEVAQLSKIPTTLNILALNQTEKNESHPNICYFSLSPTDEARDAAHHLWQRKMRKPLLIIPRGNFGDRITKAFIQEWQKIGGGSVLQQRFGSVDELKKAINFDQTKPFNNAMPLSTELQLSRTAESRGAQRGIPATIASNYVDAVYIVAKPEEIILIKSMIDMINESSAKPALFASSRSNQANINYDNRLEMEGVQFSEIPLIAGSNPSLMKQAEAKYDNDYSLIRLYAMGMDAWVLAQYFDEIRQIPSFQLSGMTGHLSVTSDCVINRKLPWLQYYQGEFIPVKNGEEL
ncbi:penicillin-binding protein activator [Candidatus Regiella insecticola]|nr:penicillin-binding protein activator [Candidatus Regiella insecticola]